jgi:hypothetical protein
MTRLTRGPRSRADGTIKVVTLAVIIAMQLVLSWPPAMAYGDTHERASSGEWLVLSIIMGGALAVVLIVLVLEHRSVNPHTRLVSKIRRKRARGPLTRPKRGT